MTKIAQTQNSAVAVQTLAAQPEAVVSASNTNELGRSNFSNDTSTTNHGLRELVQQSLAHAASTIADPFSQYQALDNRGRDSNSRGGVRGYSPSQAAAASEPTFLGKSEELLRNAVGSYRVASVAILNVAGELLVSGTDMVVNQVNDTTSKLLEGLRSLSERLENRTLTSKDITLKNELRDLGDPLKAVRAVSEATVVSRLSPEDRAQLAREKAEYSKALHTLALRPPEKGAMMTRVEREAELLGQKALDRVVTRLSEEEKDTLIADLNSYDSKVARWSTSTGINNTQPDLPHSLKALNEQIKTEIQSPVVE